MSTSHPGQVPILHLNREQIIALASAPCNEVFSTLSSVEPLSAREVAQAIERSPAAVSEQLSKLVEVGLVVHAGTRKRRSRTESLYVHAGMITRFILKGQPPDVIQAYQRRFSGQMRLVERQFDAAVEALAHDPTFQDFLIYKTVTAQVDRASALRIQLAIAEVLELIKSLGEIDPENRESGEHVRVRFSALLLPERQESAKRTKRQS